MLYLKSNGVIDAGWNIRFVVFAAGTRHNGKSAYIAIFFFIEFYNWDKSRLSSKLKRYELYLHAFMDIGLFALSGHASWRMLSNPKMRFLSRESSRTILSLDSTDSLPPLKFDPHTTYRPSTTNPRLVHGRIQRECAPLTLNFNFAFRRHSCSTQCASLAM